MPDPCPVCDDAVEHVRVERADGDGQSEAPAGGAVSFDIDDLCSVAADTRWDRICTAAAAAGDAPSLEVYYHFFGDGE